MAQRKPYNPNTKYGRKKLREQAEVYRQSLSPEERKEFDTNATLVYFIIIVVVLALIFLFSGSHGVQRYLQR